MWARASILACVGRSGQEGQAGLGLAALNHCSGLWSVGAVSSMKAPWGGGGMCGIWIGEHN